MYELMRPLNEFSYTMSSVYKSCIIHHTNFSLSLLIYYNIENYNNRRMLSFSSILNEIVKVLLRPYTTVKLMLKSF